LEKGALVSRYLANLPEKFSDLEKSELGDSGVSILSEFSDLAVKEGRGDYNLFFLLFP